MHPLRPAHAEEAADPLDAVEAVLDHNEWSHSRDAGEEGAVHLLVPSRWGDMGAVFCRRQEPEALHFSMTLDVKPQAMRLRDVALMVTEANGHLRLGHLDYWSEERAVMFCHALPLLDRDEVSLGEVAAVASAAVAVADRFVPAFNWVIWAGQTPAAALEAALFETVGEA